MSHTAGMTDPSQYTRAYPVETPDPGAAPFRLHQLGAPRPPRRRFAVAAIVVAAVLTLAAAAGVYVLFGERSFTLAGTLTLSGRGCTDSGFPDIGDGGQITVHDETDAVVALGALGTGEFVLSVGCVYSLRVDSVPGGHRFYGIEIGKRPAYRVTEAGARRGLRLTLG